MNHLKIEFKFYTRFICSTKFLLEFWERPTGLIFLYNRVKNQLQIRHPASFDSRVHGFEFISLISPIFPLNPWKWADQGPPDQPGRPTEEPKRQGEFLAPVRQFFKSLMLLRRVLGGPCRPHRQSLLFFALGLHYSEIIKRHARTKKNGPCQVFKKYYWIFLGRHCWLF